MKLNSKNRYTCAATHPKRPFSGHCAPNRVNSVKTPVPAVVRQRRQKLRTRTIIMNQLGDVARRVSPIVCGTQIDAGSTCLVAIMNVMKKPQDFVGDPDVLLGILLVAAHTRTDLLCWSNWVWPPPSTCEIHGVSHPHTPGIYICTTHASCNEGPSMAAPT